MECEFRAVSCRGDSSEAVDSATNARKDFCYLTLPRTSTTVSLVPLWIGFSLRIIVPTAPAALLAILRWFASPLALSAAAVAFATQKGNPDEPRVPLVPVEKAPPLYPAKTCNVSSTCERAP
ncbi:unnamed protein product [Mycena citricolor]|uniref:Uncharacterized protein n=1 Tax=Mycena citricolor TaxID=2018698 RepID=A0AAD2HHB8_9AGAR|nr:unnamed protein product [Mycena citricolor]